MSKYSLGEAHQGEPTISMHVLADNTKKNSDICGMALAMDSNGKVVIADGSKQFLGVGVSKGTWSELNSEVAVLKKGQKVLVKTNGTAAIGSAVYVDANGKFTSNAQTSSVDNQPINAIFVGQDDVENAETLPENTALIDLL